MTTITVLRPTTVNAPRATAAAAALFSRVLGWMDSSAQARAERSAVAARLAESAEMRRFAEAHAYHDPRVVAELLAAADRHEQGR